MSNLEKMTESQLRHHQKHLNLRLFHVLRALCDERAWLYSYLGTGKLKNNLFAVAINADIVDMENEIRIRVRTLEARIGKVEAIKAKALSEINQRLVDQRLAALGKPEWPHWERTSVGNCPWCWASLWSENHEPECKQRQLEYDATKKV